MGDTKAVALLFDDAELGSQLRMALQERGARIVHEGGLLSLNAELLQKLDADVVVINLDDQVDDALDHLYAVIDGDRPSVVFNDAQASRALDGWDRARWARHLAAKVLAVGDIDPPRPEPASAAPSLDDAPQVPVAAPAAASFDALDHGRADDGEGEHMAALSFAEATVLEPDMDVQHERQAATESETLEAELEALLAAEPSTEPDESSAGESRMHDDELAEFDGFLHTHEFSESIESPADEPADAVSHEVAPHEAAPAFSLDDELQLLDLDEFIGEVPAATVLAPAEQHAAGSTPRLFESWSLVDEDTAPAVAQKPDPAQFGIEKMSAADFLAPEVEQVSTALEPGMTLELIAPEDAIAPMAYEPQEIVLNEFDTVVGRLILLGATVDSLPSVNEFLDLLPAGLRASILLVQHMAGASADVLLATLAKHSALPLRLAEQGLRVRHGELIVVPPDHQVLIRRDGTLDLLPAGTGGSHNPSIDANFSALANVFGRDALAILFAGKANDAVAGCQAVHDRGGRVWVEASSGEHYADMVSGVMAERLVDFSGSPTELAARLIEEY
jgi:two-component system chemotaxis response regulator CheB/chemosensory pili system protein ChpB (putative protein-glutamate methylesterase)